jgi:Putative translation factor (SUA5)
MIPGKIAIRVSNHLPIKQLLEEYKGFMVSTSANLSGQSNINSPKKILETFTNDDIAYYDETLGNQLKPSQIIDLETGIILRE